MDFFDFLFTYIPHRWLDRTKPGVVRLFGGLAKILEWLDSYRGIVIDNSSTRTATELLPDLESEFGLTVNPANIGIIARRQKIISKKREHGGVVQEDDLLSLLAAYGLKGTLERPEHCVLIVNIPAGRKPDRLFENVGELLESNIRAHVGYTMSYNAEISHNVFTGNIVFVEKRYKIEPTWTGTSPSLEHDVAVGVIGRYKKSQEIEVIY